MSTLLLITIFLPAFGAGVVWAVAPGGQKAVRAAALGGSLVTLLLAGLLVFQFPGETGEPGKVDPGKAAAFGESTVNWLNQPRINIQFSLGLDGLSVWLFGLSALLTVTSVLVSWEAIKEAPAGFYALLLML